MAALGGLDPRISPNPSFSYRILKVLGHPAPPPISFGNLSLLDFVLFLVSVRFGGRGVGCVGRSWGLELMAATSRVTELLGSAETELGVGTGNWELELEMVMLGNKTTVQFSCCE